MNSKRLTAGVTGKRGSWREKPPDAESAVGAGVLKVLATPRTCPVHAVLGRFLITKIIYRNPLISLCLKVRQLPQIRRC